MSPHPLTNFEILKYYQSKPRFNGVRSRNNLPKIQYGTYVINIYEYKSIDNHWITLYVNGNNVKYFNSFKVEHIPKEIKTFIDNKNVTTIIFRMQTYDSVMCGYFSIRFIGFMLKGKSLLEYGNLFSPNKYERNNFLIRKQL